MSPIDRLIKEDRTLPRRILVIGDGMIDVYIHGHMVDCQEGCPKFMEEYYITRPGGAANAAKSLEHWFASRICVYDHGDCPIKTRFMVDDKCVFRHDDDRTNLDFGIIRHQIMETLVTWKPEGVLISDYDKGLLTPEFIQVVIVYCTARKIPCVVDAKREPALYEGAILKANGSWGVKYRTVESYRSIKDTPVKNGVYVETHGGRYPGVWDGDRWIPTEDPYEFRQVTCLNHVGAGDCFAAHLTLALACGLSLKDAAAVAHSAGRVYVQRRHNTPPHPDEIKADMVGNVIADRG